MYNTSKFWEEEFNFFSKGFFNEDFVEINRVSEISLDFDFAPLNMAIEIFEQNEFVQYVPALYLNALQPLHLPNLQPLADSDVQPLPDTEIDLNPAKDESEDVMPFACACSFCCSNKEDSDTSSIVESGTNNGAAAVTPSGNPLIDGVLIGQQWSDASIDYSFSLTSTPYDAYTNSDLVDIAQNMTVLTALQEANVHFVLDADTGPAAAIGFSVEGFTNLTVNNLGNVDDVDAQIRFGNTTSSQLGTARVADFPGSVVTSNVADDGDVWFGPLNNNIYQSPTAGNYAWATHIHEIGHALGLAHGHDTFAFQALPSEYDSMEYSIMTYRSYIGASTTSGYTNETWGYAQTFMMSDIAALQYMYGADFTVNSGDTVYSWDPSSGDTLIDGVVAINPGGNRIFATIWDGDGIDTYDLSAYTTDLQIDLSPGGHSLFSAVQQANLGSGNFARGNIFNALQYEGDARSLIENAIGGTGNDSFVGNAADNSFDGGTGTDLVSYAGEVAAVIVDLSGSTATATGASIGTDTFISIENITGTDFADTITGDDAINTLIGGLGIDTLNGSGGNDILFGGLDADTLNGDDGDDTIYGGNNTEFVETPESGISFGTGQYARAANAGNDFIANAIDISDQFSLDADADIIDAETIPHVSVTATGDGGDVHYYAVNLTTVDTTITLDIDYGTAGGYMDSWIELYDASGNLVASNDDFSTTSGEGGSVSVFDSFLSYTTLAAGIYYIAVGTYYVLSDIPAGGTYELQVSVEESTPVIEFDDSNDTIKGGAGNDTLHGEAGDDYFSGGTGEDTIFGGSGNDLAYGGADNDTIAGDGGNDTLYGGAGDDIVSGGAGNDTLVGQSGNDTLNGGGSADTLSGGADNDILNGDSGNDTLYGQSGDDTINGGDGADLITGQYGNDIIDGGADNDNIFAGFGEDIVYGGAGDDIIRGEGQNDELHGGDGDDTLTGGTGGDMMYGDADNDTMYGQGGFDTMFGGSGNDSMYGGDANDLMSGQSGNDTLYGGNGNDTINGNFNDDVLFGNAGNDILNGGYGSDILNGGTGNDSFIFGQNYGSDTVNAFKDDEDTLVLNSNLGFGTIAQLLDPANGWVTQTDANTVTFDFGNGDIFTINSNSNFTIADLFDDIMIG